MNGYRKENKMVREGKNWKEKTMEAIMESDKESFSVATLKEFLPGRKNNLITGNLISLERDGDIFRTGARVKVGSKSFFVQYTINEALSAKAVEDSSMRGYSEEEKQSMSIRKRVEEQEKELIVARKANCNLRAENKKLKAVLTNLPQHQLIDLLLDN